MKFTFDGFKMTDPSADDIADRLDYITKQIREGFTSGDAGGAGWWDLSTEADA